MRPEILPGYEPWYSAFWKLSDDRPLFQGGAGPIPFSSVLNYPEIDADEFDFFLEIIKQLDNVWLRYYHEGAEAAIKGKKPKQFPKKVSTL